MFQSLLYSIRFTPTCILRYACLHCLIFLCNPGLQAQTSATLSGHILSEEGTPLEEIHLHLIGTSRKARTDSNGYYIFHNLHPGKYKLIAYSVTHHDQEINIELFAGSHTTKHFTLKEKGHERKAIAIRKKKDVMTETREQAYAVTVIDARPLHNTNQDINQVLNKTSGVRIRETGGLGSSFTFSLNGFTGNQIKFYLDGIPMDNFGSSLTLNNIPINMAERIEIYKGVVPVHLGSDALGGAVNVVTNQKIKRYADISYSYGSFNTHRFAANTRYRDDSTGINVNLGFFYNYSDNNYRILTETVDPATRAYGEPVWRERFHDQYKSHTLNVEVGVTNKIYADRLLFGLITSGNYKEVQTGYNMERPYGHVYRTDDVFIPSFKYKKDTLFVKGLSFNTYASYNIAKSQVADTSSRIYNWDQQYTVRTFPAEGETGDYKTLFHFNDRVAMTTTNLSYELNKNHSFAFNHTFNKMTRVGEDPIARDPIPFSSPNILNKNIFGLSYKLVTLKKKLSTTVFTKYFLMHATTRDARWGFEDDIQTKYNKGGVGMAIAYHLRPNLLFKTSYERTCRLPTGEEMFGDGLNIYNNAELRPERSNNLNIGMLYSKVVNKHKFTSEVLFIYRQIEDLVRMRVMGPKGMYENLPAARTMGVEGSLVYNYNKVLNIEANGTFQDLRNTMKYDPPGSNLPSVIYMDRVPNIPYLFGSVTASYLAKKVIHPKGNMSFYYTFSYVEEFYLQWPSMGDKDSKFTIPRQMSHNAGVTYSFDDSRYNISVECLNFTNSILYDNYRLQKPPRTFAIKLRYFISK